MYHEVTEGEAGEYSINVADFEAQLQALADAGYTTVSFDELYDYVTTGAELPEKPIVITFDDGYMNNYTLAFPDTREIRHEGPLSSPSAFPSVRIPTRARALR